MSSDEGSGVHPISTEPFTAVTSDLKPVGVAFGQAGTLARCLSVQIAAKVGNRATACQVIIRNTHKPQDSQDNRGPSVASISRSQSLLTTHKTVTPTPKRNERIQLEYALGDVWTRDKLPCPGMANSRSGHIIRAFVGSLVRKLSLASMHGPFARRPMNRSPNEIPLDVGTEAAIGHPKYSVVDETRTLNEPEEDSALTEEPTAEQKDEAPERLSLTGVDRLIRRGTKKAENVHSDSRSIAAEETSLGQVVVEEKLGSGKRWSNPLGLLKNFSTEDVRHMLYSSKLFPFIVYMSV